MSSNATVPDATVGPTFAQVFGPVFWGFCVSLILGGVSALQGYLYFTRYNDKLPVRLVAAMMLTLDFLSVALICQSMYYYMLPHFGSFAPLNHVTSELNIECLISAVITFTSQMYFVYQLYMVKSPGMTASVMKALVIVFGTVGLAGAVGCVAMMFKYPHSIFMNRNHVFAILAGIAKGFGAAADIVATIAMCMFLSKADTGIRRTSSMLKSLMHLVINRGILVTVAQILLLVTFFATSGHLYWLAVHINTTKLYVNTFFGMLNARTSLQERYATGHMSISGDTTAYSQRLAAAANSQMAAREKLGELGPQDYAMGAIRVTTSSTVADI
ncbi:hypothetical protein MVEN_02276800 [Mycena venus]|uniref:DUF6534 domain-containing protein n=1 Tax=Mycena venus TaxID=2733690 RepID=A0A8H6X4S9_9AGAR|nr:hypothetical protein MVEN_02276800 [Mycena venus]